MNKDNGDVKSLTGYEGDTGSDEDDPLLSSAPKDAQQWPLETAATASHPALNTSATTMLATSFDLKPAATALNTLVLGYHTIYDLDNTDIPLYVREHGATLTFPEKLMLKLMHVDRSVAKAGTKPTDFPLSWTADGKAFVIRDKAELCKNWLPVFFQQAKFSSFTRKLYRWGFRQIKHHSKPKNSQSGDTYFGNENFQRDNTALLASMRSVTAIKSKRQQHNSQWTEIVPAIPATTTTPKLPDAAMDFSLFLQQQDQQQQHNLAALQIAPPVAPPPLPAARASTFDMSNAFLQPGIAQASQLQLSGAGNYMNLPIPGHPQPQNQYHETFGSNTSTDYLRQLAQLAATSNQPSMNSFALQPPQPMSQMATPFLFQPHPPYPMAGLQENNVPLQQLPQASQTPDQQQQQLLQALQLMLDQSQQQQHSNQQNLPPDNPD